MYDIGLGGNSQKWMVDHYELLGFRFRRIVGWEAEPLDPAEMWSRVPTVAKKARITYFNIPATANRYDGDNPLTHLRALATPQDYVVLKIDVDVPPLELPLVLAISKSTELQALIDEFYWEHHVIKSPMAFIAWPWVDRSTTLADSFRLFSHLRHKGIRAHSWV